jgi:hypothetical protein
MTCREFWDRMPELETDGQPLQHARECASCAALLERQQALAMGLRRVASQRDELKAPAHLEERLLEAFRERAGAPVEVPAILGWPRRSAQVYLAAAVIMLGVFLVWRRPSHPIRPVAVAETSSSVLDSDFIPLPYAGEPRSVEDAHLIHVEMPRSALIALGVPVADGEAGEPVEAEVLLGLGGAPEAVRVLQ